MAENELSFTIKTGLKNIIGRDLITDDFVAVFELVKNSFDAYAQNVIITFKKDAIIISDDGKGMDLDDINKKWLAVAYSAKKEGVEDNELENEEFNSYRDKIQAKKYFAGAKGIGRFSCDKLGNVLTLTTRKASVNSLTEQITVNWKDFENDSKEEFIAIKVKHRTLQTPNTKFVNFQHGTILEIKSLNSEWTREKKRNLKHSLEKLINPFEDNPLNGFSVTIEDSSELDGDKIEKISRDKINGKIKNFVLETLDIKTTQILTEIDGDFITTTLKDRGTLIYKIKRRNTTNPKLNNIRFHLFQLNRIAKTNFSRLMGLPPVDFGSIFLYKNGFRVAPYGDVGYDYLGLDTRKTQKHFDRLGSRDVIGRIEILGENPHFKESSSRDGGLERNEFYKSLLSAFMNECLKKLEEYLKKVQWTNKDDKNHEDLGALNNILSKSALLKLVSEEIEDDDAELLDADQTNLNIRTQELLNNASSNDIAALKIIAEKLGSESFSYDTKRAEEDHIKILKLQEKLAEGEFARQLLEKEREEAIRSGEEKEKVILFQQKLLTKEVVDLIEFHHVIGISADTIEKHLINLQDDLSKHKMPTKEDLIDLIDCISYESKKITSLTNMATAANFSADADEITTNLYQFIKQYSENLNLKTSNGSHLSLNVEDIDINFQYNFKPLELAIILDNLFSNSIKAKASEVALKFEVGNENNLYIHVIDNGIGIKKDKIDKIFNFGYTTTSGSGMGLHHIHRIITENYNSNIEYKSLEKGSEFILNFKK